MTADQFLGYKPMRRSFETVERASLRKNEGAGANRGYARSTLERSP
jgi:hypothetical protein